MLNTWEGARDPVWYGAVGAVEAEDKAETESETGLVATWLGIRDREAAKTAVKNRYSGDDSPSRKA